MTVDEQGRPEPPIAADEAATLVGFLDFQRATLEWKCAGLDAAGLNTSVAASTMTLGGMLKHMALVEDQWFSWVLHADKPWPPWDTVDWKADRDWDWHSAADDTPDQLRTMWREAVERARGRVTEALADRGLGRLADDTRHQFALDRVPHDRGVRAAQRSCRLDSGIHRRRDRRVAAPDQCVRCWGDRLDRTGCR
jgi:hypothetical protein